MGVADGASAIASAVKASNGRHPLGQRLLVIPAMIWATLRRRWPGAPKVRVIGGMLGIAYLLTPVDLMPEIFLGPFGLGDDLALAAASVAALLSAAEEYLDMRDDTLAVPGSAAEVVPGVVISRDGAGT